MIKAKGNIWKGGTCRINVTKAANAGELMLFKCEKDLVDSFIPTVLDAINTLAHDCDSDNVV